MIKKVAYKRNIFSRNCLLFDFSFFGIPPNIVIPILIALMVVAIFIVIGILFSIADSVKRRKEKRRERDINESIKVRKNFEKIVEDTIEARKKQSRTIGDIEYQSLDGKVDLSKIDSLENLNGKFKCVNNDLKQTYIGEMFKGKKSGKGTFCDEISGITYEGEFKEDEFIRGEMKTPKFCFNGTFKKKDDGSPHFYGKITTNDSTPIRGNIAEYEGDYSSNKFEGIGIFKYTNGDVYKGKIKNNLPNGFGVLTKADGVELSGIFDNNKLKDGLLKTSDSNSDEDMLRIDNFKPVFTLKDAEEKQKWDSILNSVNI